MKTLFIVGILVILQQKSCDFVQWTVSVQGELLLRFCTDSLTYSL